ncbi:MAG: hypothetical protein ACOYOV_09025 [Bacteroidales bacterium]
MNYKIKKVKIKDRTLTVDMNEIVSNENGTVTNEVTKKCAYLAHDDLLLAFKGMIPHLIKICDFKGSENIFEDNIANFEAFPEYSITGISIGGSGEYEGVTIVAQREFPSGKVLNIVTPFQTFSDIDYPLGDELSLAVEACISEVHSYLFDNKFAEKQMEMDFGGMDEEASVTDAEKILDLIEGKPFKKGKKQKQLAEEAA